MTRSWHCRPRIITSFIPFIFLGDQKAKHAKGKDAKKKPQPKKGNKVSDEAPTLPPSIVAHIASERERVKDKSLVDIKLYRDQIIAANKVFFDPSLAYQGYQGHQGYQGYQGRYLVLTRARSLIRVIRVEKWCSFECSVFFSSLSVLQHPNPLCGDDFVNIRKVLTDVASSVAFADVLARCKHDRDSAIARERRLFQEAFDEFLRQRAENLDRLRSETYKRRDNIFYLITNLLVNEFVSISPSPPPLACENANANALMRR